MKNQNQSFARSIFAFGVAALIALLPLCLAAQAPAPDSPAIEAKAQALLAKLTLDEKIKLLGGVDGMFTQAIPSIGLPRFKMSDASVGVRTWGPTTAYAGGVALAATWDKDFARVLGTALGRDARARGVNFLLGPGVNIARSSVGGRNFEYLSEDPYLNSALVVPYIQGVQSQGVIATVKHYAVNNQEYNRHNVDVTVDERTLREIYLPAFEAAVTQAHVDAVMNSYNLLNGSHATQSEFLNLKVLKGEWGFPSILMSDWDATYDGVAAANNGLDLEMPDAAFMNAADMLAAVKSGKVKESTIDGKVLRLLRTVLRYGFLDRPQFDPAYSTYSVADRAVALNGALESITLLKNDGQLLPLDAAKIKTIAVIGPDAWPAIAGGGGSSEAQAFEPVSILTGIANTAGPKVNVLYSRGLPEMGDLFWRTHWDGAVKVDDYPSNDFTGTPKSSTEERMTNWRPDGWEADATTPRGIRYTAHYKAEKAGKYLLLVASGEWNASDFIVRVNGKQLLSQERSEGQIPLSAIIELAAGETAEVVAELHPRSNTPHFGLGIVYEPELISAEAKEIAAKADIVVIAAGFNQQTEGEGHDRTFALPWGQDALIEAAVAANPRTIVTLTAGGAVDTRRWLDKVPALLHLFYPGQEGGAAVGQVLFGQHNPEGKLPVSFERSWEESPSAQFYYPIKGADTAMHVTTSTRPPADLVIPHLKYDDKLLVGYRYWTTTGKHPLYPFGYGLSYTTFSFAKLESPATAASGSTVPVSFDVTNTGTVVGAEVAELYVSDPSAKASRPERELKGFEKVNLAPGETKHVTLNLDARAFSYWDETAHKWAIDPGKFVVRVGDSSENTPLSAEVTLK
jgi:beta-glucosidase